MREPIAGIPDAEASRHELTIPKQWRWADRNASREVGLGVVLIPNTPTERRDYSEHSLWHDAQNELATTTDQGSANR